MSCTSASFHNGTRACHWLKFGSDLNGLKLFIKYIHTGCPRVAKKLHTLFVLKDIDFFFFLDDSYASTAYSENIAVYIQGVPLL
jgi:hypothetical protein